MAALLEITGAESDKEASFSPVRKKVQNCHRLIRETGGSEVKTRHQNPAGELSD